MMMNINSIILELVNEWYDDNDSAHKKFKSFKEFILFAKKNNEEILIVGITNETILSVITTPANNYKLCNIYSIKNNFEIYVSTLMVRKYKTDVLRYWNNNCLNTEYTII